MTESITIYVFKCKHDKYYIGKTKDILTRIKQHYDGKGSMWTKLHPPIDIVESINDCDKFDEDKYTLKYMEKYGIDNVRGGIYSEVVLNSDKIKTINELFNSANDCCFKCGEIGHFIHNCPYKIKKENDGMIRYIGESIVGFSEWLWGNNEIKRKTKKELKCFKCGRSGHFIQDCYAKTDIHGNKLEKLCIKCGRCNHYSDKCYAKYHKDGKKI